MKQMSLFAKAAPKQRATRRRHQARIDPGWSSVFMAMRGEGEAAEQRFGHLLRRIPQRDF
jgi:hypothetical protein